MDISIVIPFRNRHQHLLVLLRNLREHLSDKNTEYIVVQQLGSRKFNRGLLLNTGFRVSKGSRVIFHDVDLVPCAVMARQYCDAWPESVVHFGCRFSRYNNTKSYFGGVVGFTRCAFPGFSNRYFGWGGEDDSLRRRVSSRVARPETGAYTDLEFMPTVKQKLNSLTQNTKCMNKWEVRDSEDYTTDNHSTCNVDFIETYSHEFGCRWIDVEL